MQLVSWFRRPSGPTGKALRSLFVGAGREPPRDLGLFGPGSMCWRLHAHPASFLGGGRALLVQALHPTVMSIFAQNTAYQAGPWGRLLRTSVYFAETTFGDTATAHAAARRLRSIHDRIRGVDPDTGAERSAGDPDLLLWVHSTAVHSFVTSYRRFAGRLSEAEADRYTEEMLIAGDLVGIPRAMLPTTFDEVRSYVRGMANLRVTPEAMEGMRMVLFDPPVPRPLVPAWRIAAQAMISILPRRARELYGLPWTPLANPPARLIGIATARLLDAALPPPWHARQAFALARRSRGGALAAV